MHLDRRTFALGLISSPLIGLSAREARASISPKRARSIAKEAFIYGYPMIDSYRIQHAYFVDESNPQYKNDYNKIANVARVFTPADTAVQTPQFRHPLLNAGS